MNRHILPVKSLVKRYTGLKVHLSYTNVNKPYFYDNSKLSRSKKTQCLRYCCVISSVDIVPSSFTLLVDKLIIAVSKIPHYINHKYINNSVRNSLENESHMIGRGFLAAPEGSFIVNNLHKVRNVL